MRYAMLMRGVNVGGVKVPMAELSTLLAELGLSDVKTVLQSGNVAFDSDLQPGDLKRQLEPALTERFGYEAFVQIYPLDRIAEAIAAYPFPADADRHSYVVFCEDEATRDALLEGAEPDPAVERLAAGDGVVFWQVERGSTLKTPFAKQMARARFKAGTTNRNLNTLQKLAAA